MTEPLLLLGDCVAVMASMEPDSIDAIVCDPPYGIGFMGKEWDDSARMASVPPSAHRLASEGKDPHPKTGKGPSAVSFDGRAFQTWCEAWAREALRVLKPGGHLLAFGGTRTVHRMVVAIEDAGFEVRDLLMWGYSSGFPKSHDVSKAIDKAAGATREVVGPKMGQPGYSLATTPQQGVAMAGNVDGSLRNPEAEVAITAPATPDAERWAGWGTALKPAWEPICMARKPLIGTVAGNLLQYGTGALNIGATRIGTAENLNGGAYAKNPTERHDGDENWRYPRGSSTGFVQPDGRWPANVILTDPILDGGWDGVVGGGNSTSGAPGVMRVEQNNGAAYGAESRKAGHQMVGYGDTGTNSRFFLVPKANRREREPDPEAAEAEGLTGLYCNCETDKPWVTAPPGSESPPRDTSEAGALTDDSDFITTSSGSSTTEPSQTDIKSTIGTETSRTTTSETSSALTPPLTSASMEDANSGMASGGSPAWSATGSSPSTPSTGTSPLRGGPSTGSADPVTSLVSSETNACAVCGLLKPSDGTPVGGGDGVVTSPKRHNDHPT